MCIRDRGVADGGSPVAAALGGGELGGRFVLADGDVAIAEGVTWSEWMGVKKDRSASCSVFRGKSDARGRDRAPQGGRSSRDNSFIRGSRNRNAWPEKKAAGGVFAPARADVNPPPVDVEGGGWWKGSRTVEGLDGDLSLVHVGVLDDAVAAGAALAAGGNAVSYTHLTLPTIYSV